MKRHDGRGTRKSELQVRPGFLCRCCRFVHRPGGAVILRPSGKNGFTLVEILATFVLMAIILPVAMNGISMASKLANKAKHRVTAGALAEQMLSEFVLSGDYEDGDQKGEISSGNTEFAWQLEVLDWEEEDAMQQLDMSVTWEDAGGRESTVLLSTLVYTGSEG